MKSFLQPTNSQRKTILTFSAPDFYKLWAVRPTHVFLIVAT